MPITYIGIPLSGAAAGLKATDSVFVQHPHIRGSWIKTDRSVILAACDACGARVGEPCVGGSGINSSTHHQRRSAANRAIRMMDAVIAEAVAGNVARLS